MSACLKKNTAVLRRLQKCSRKERESILANADESLIRCICEISQNTLNNNVPLTSSQLKKLSRHKSILRRLCGKKESWKKKKKIIYQTGGFILPLLAPLLGVFLQKLIG